MVKVIEIRSIITNDVKIAQKALETIGFKTKDEGDSIDAYWVKLFAPYKYDVDRNETKLQKSNLENNLL